MPSTAEKRKTSRKSAGKIAKKRSPIRNRTARMQTAPGLSEYGDSAARFLEKSQQALTSMYGWAEKKGRRLPGAIAHAQLQGTKSLQTLAEEKAMILGAAGVGLGVLIGAMLPAMSSGSRNRGRNRSSAGRRYH